MEAGERNGTESSMELSAYDANGTQFERRMEEKDGKRPIMHIHYYYEPFFRRISGSGRLNLYECLFSSLFCVCCCVHSI